MGLNCPSLSSIVLISFPTPESGSSSRQCVLSWRCAQRSVTPSFLKAACDHARTDRHKIGEANPGTGQFECRSRQCESNTQQGAQDEGGRGRISSMIAPGLLILDKVLLRSSAVPVPVAVNRLVLRARLQQAVVCVPLFVRHPAGNVVCDSQARHPAFFCGHRDRGRLSRLKSARD